MKKVLIQATRNGWLICDADSGMTLTKAKTGNLLVAKINRMQLFVKNVGSLIPELAAQLNQNKIAA